MLMNLPDGNGNDNDIKPSGMMKVSPNNTAKHQIKSKRKYFSPSQKTTILVLCIAVVLVTVLIMSNFANDFVDYHNDNLAETNNAVYNDMFFNPITNANICGIWVTEDYVENIEDFDVHSLNYVKNKIRIYWNNIEFFEDGTAVINSASDPEKYTWTNAYKLNISINNNPDGNIPIYEIKNIEGREYIFVGSGSYNPETEIKMTGYYVLKRGRVKWVYSSDDVRNKDLRNYNLSDVNDISIRTLSFNEKTRFPTDKRKMPQINNNYPEYVMEQGKNPGLGIRELHGQGITGKGVSIAIIDEPLFMHPEYKDSIVEYKDFTGQSASSMEGPAVASLLAGKNIGTAPGVKIYYAAVPSWKEFDAGYYADALDWIVETNNILPNDNKIKAVCIAVNPKEELLWINVEKYLESFIRAEEAGILVLDCSNEHGMVIGACSRSLDNPDDITLCKAVSTQRIMIAPYHYDTVQEIYQESEDPETTIRAPINCRTMAEIYSEGDFSYQYNGKGELSWAIPYTTGVLAMGWQVRPELTSNEITKILFDTAYVDKSGNKFINPTAFIEYLKNN